MSTREFSTAEETGGFAIGRLDGEAFSGAYLSAEYMSQLRELLHYASLRAAATDVPDAVHALIHALSGLAAAHAKQATIEGYPMTEADRAALESAQLELKRLRKMLDGGSPPEDSGSDA